MIVKRGIPYDRLLARAGEVMMPQLEAGDQADFGRLRFRPSPLQPITCHPGMVENQVRLAPRGLGAEQSGSNCRAGMRAIRTHIAERYEPPPTLIPKHQPDALQALDEREPAGRSELGMIPQYLR